MIPATTRTFSESREEIRRRNESYTTKVLAMVSDVPGQGTNDYARATRTPSATCQMILTRAERTGKVRSELHGNVRTWFLGGAA